MLLQNKQPIVNGEEVRRVKMHFVVNGPRNLCFKQIHKAFLFTFKLVWEC